MLLAPLPPPHTPLMSSLLCVFVHSFLHPPMQPNADCTLYSLLWLVGADVVPAACGLCTADPTPPHPIPCACPACTSTNQWCLRCTKDWKMPAGWGSDNIVSVSNRLSASPHEARAVSRLDLPQPTSSACPLQLLCASSVTTAL
jgi:hypothetical protein